MVQSPPFALAVVSATAAYHLFLKLRTKDSIQPTCPTVFGDVGFDIGEIDMHENNIVYLTEEGIQKIKEELQHLKTAKRAEISERLEAAISHGDLSENADYDYAKQEQAFVEGRIKDLEDSLRRAQVINHDGRADKVRVGSTVTIVEEGFDDEETYTIVGVHEANPSNGLISNESPIGQALLNARLGQVVTVATPSGEARFCVKLIQ